jgi:hypothetical protein
MRLLALAAFALCSPVVAPCQNQCLVLQNGTTGYVDAPYSATLAPRGGITVEAWITYNSAIGTGWRFPTIARMNSNPNQSTWFLRVEAGNSLANRMLFWVTTPGGTVQVNWFYAAGALATWTHVAATYDGSIARIFANGVQVAQATGSAGAISDTGGTFRIGSGDLSVTGGETWNGEIDELRVWPYARSAAAIASTMNLRLSAIPGEVSTWNLDGDALDSSGGNHGTAVGTAAFAPSSLVQTTPPTAGLFPVGHPSGCVATGLIGASALATVGNAGFGYVGTRGAATSLGLLLLSTAAFPGPVPVFGIDVFVDISVGVLIVGPSSAIGTSEVPFAIPNNPTLAGVSLASQFAWLDGSCASGFSASDAMLTLVIL